MSKFRVPLHPFLICSWFVLLAYRESQPFVRWPELFGCWLILLGGVYVIYRGIKFFVKEPCKASVLTSLFVIFFCFLYPLRLQVRYYLKSVPHGSDISHARYVLPFLCFTFALLAWIILRSRKDLWRFKIYLNVASLLLVTIALWDVIAKPLPRFDPPLAEESDEQLIVPTNNAPDIYYILLDAHTSPESLKTFWNYDSSDFTNFLTTNGFYVVPNAHGNYTATPVCMAASLDMRYPPDIPDSYPFASKAAEMFNIIVGANVPKKLQSAGYDIVNLSLFPILDQPKYYRFPFLNFSSFADVLFERSALHYYNAFYKQIKMGESNLKIFSHLAEIPSRPASRPRFIYAHILMPHSPFLFDREGRRVMKGLTTDQNKNDYLEQLIYTDKIVMKTLVTILEKSKVPPIIILQGDHGFRWLQGETQPKEASTILNAYYFPGGQKEWIYEGITPVNSFRLVFNHYFGTHYKYLPDVQHLDQHLLPRR